MGSQTTALSVPKDHKNPTYDSDEDGDVDSLDEQSVNNISKVWSDGFAPGFAG
jgi:hypothetical protein